MHRKLTVVTETIKSIYISETWPENRVLQTDQFMYWGCYIISVYGSIMVPVHQQSLQEGTMILLAWYGALERNSVELQ
jgi:hypothetical protein